MNRGARARITADIDELRKQVYRELPAAGWNLIAQVDASQPYGEIARRFSDDALGVDSKGAALALSTLYRDRGYRAVCYDCGIPSAYTHTFTLVEKDGRIFVEDAFLNLRFADDLDAIVAQLERGTWPDVIEDSSLRKRIISDDTAERPEVMKWLRRRGGPGRLSNGVRMFEFDWNLSDLRATASGFKKAVALAGVKRSTSPIAALLPHGVGVVDERGFHPGVELAAIKTFLAASVAAPEPSETGAQDARAAALAAEVKELRVQLRKADRNNRELMDALSAERARLADTSSELARLSEKVSQTDEHNRDLDVTLANERATAESLRNELAAKNESLTEAERRRAALEEMIAAQRSAAESLQHELAMTTNALRQSEERGCGLDRALAEERALHKGTQTQLAQARADIEREKGHRATLQKQIQEQADELRQTARELQQTEERQRTTAGELEQLRSRLAQLRAELDDERTARSAAQQHARELESRASALQRDLSALLVQRATAVNKAEQASRSMHSLSEALTSAEVELDRTRQLNVGLATELKEARDQIEDLRNSAQAITGQLQVSQGELTRLQENARNTEAQFTLMHNQITLLGAERDAERATRLATEARERTLEREMDAARAELQALVTARASSELRIEELSRSMRELADALTAAELEKSLLLEAPLGPAESKGNAAQKSPAPSPLVDHEMSHALALGPAGARDGEGHISSLVGRADCIFFGPYAQLPAGRYEAVFEFRSARSLRARLAGVALDVVDRGNVLASRVVSTWRQRIKATLPFEVTPEMFPPQIETRAHSQGAAEVTLLQCRIKAAD